MIKECKKHGLTEFREINASVNSRSRCLKCASEAVSKRRRRVKEDLLAIFGGKCIICGYDKYHGALQFHHLDPSSKEFGLSVKGLTKKFSAMLEEANKCILVCGNCHSEIHAGLHDTFINNLRM